MKFRNQVAFALFSLLLSATAVTAQQKPTAPTLTPTASPQLSPTPTASPQVTPTPTDSLQPTPAPISSPETEELTRLREEKRVRELVEKSLASSKDVRDKEVSDRIGSEIDRTFSRATTQFSILLALLNVLLVVLTLLPILSAIGVWLLRRSVISQLVSETKKQLKEEVEQQLNKELAADLSTQINNFKQEMDKLKSEFLAQVTDTQNLLQEKNRLIQQLSNITPVSIQEPVTPETQQKIEDLTRELEQLKSASANSQLLFTAEDYVNQGNALYYSRRSEEALVYYNKALQLQPENYNIWTYRGSALYRSGRYEEAIESFDKAVAIKPDAHKAWSFRGNALFKLKRYEEAIASYDKAIEINPNFADTWYYKARCYAVQGNVDLAIENLQKAVSMSRGFLKRAKNDSEFDEIREDERFKQLRTKQLT